MGSQIEEPRTAGPAGTVDRPGASDDGLAISRRTPGGSGVQPEAPSRVAPLALESAARTASGGGGAAARLRRGGLVAGAATLLAGALAKASERLAQAADGEPLLLGRVNTATRSTVLDRGESTITEDGLRVTNSNGTAVTARSTGPQFAAAVWAESRARLGPGVRALATGSDAWGVLADGETGVLGRGQVGVEGIASGPGSAVGVLGSGPTGVQGSGVSAGVRGSASATDGVGLLGTSPRSGQAAGVMGDGATGVVGTGGLGVMGTGETGVAGRGETGVFGGGSFGVLGVTPQAPGGSIAVGVTGRSGGPGTGVRGESSNGIGVDGSSVTGVGVAGSGGYTGVYAETTGGGNAAYLGTPELAGDFHGDVRVRGALLLDGASAEATALADGSQGRLYALASPEGWLEDFGSGTLTGGTAQVSLDPAFASLVQGDAYHVFLAPEGDSRGLYVSQKGAAGFEVREQQGGTSSLPFSYRVVAKRKAGAGPRLARVAPVPRRAAPTRPQLPQVKVPEGPLPQAPRLDLPQRTPAPEPPR